jgi:hypothetical protein
VDAGDWPKDFMPPEVWRRVVGRLDASGFGERIRRVVIATSGRHEETDSQAEVAGYVSNWAVTCCTSAVDHLRTWHALLIAGQQPVMAHYSLCRGVMDGAVRCLWLLDGDEAERRARGGGLQLLDHDERHKFEVDAQSGRPTKPEAKTGKERYEIAQAHLARAGIVPRSVPGWTDLYRDYAIAEPMRPRAGAAVYRFLSAYAHGHAWGHLGAELGDLDQAYRVGDAVVIRAKDDFVERFADHARDAVDRAMAAMETLGG